jgi:hypothetical protein
MAARRDENAGGDSRARAFDDVVTAGTRYLEVGLGLGLVGALACYLRWLIRSAPIPITLAFAIRRYVAH